MSSIKDIVYLGIIGVLLIMLWLKGCNKSAPCPEVVATHTIIEPITGKSDSSYKPKPVATIPDHKPASPTTSHKPVARDLLFDAGTSNGSEADYTNHSVKVPATDPPPLNIYRDTLRMDTLGYMVVKDTVRGEILGRSFNYLVNKFSTTKTIAVKPRNKLFFGVEAMGDKSMPVQYLGGSIALQLKRSDNIMSIGAGAFNGQLMYKAGIYFKIKLR